MTASDLQAARQLPSMQPQSMSPPPTTALMLRTPPPVAARASSIEDARKEKRNARDRRRSRLKRESMAEMRAVVAGLEAEKRRLELQLRGAGPGITRHEAQHNDDHDYDEGAPRRYLRVLREIERLRVENRVMTLDVLERDLFRSAVQNTLDGIEREERALVAAEAAASAASVRALPPLPEPTARATARWIVTEILAAHGQRATMHNLTGAQVCGWSDFRCRTGTTIMFTIRKTFPNQAPVRLAQRTWEILTMEAMMARVLPPNVVCELDEVQRVDDDTVIIHRRTQTQRAPARGPPPALRTTYMLHRAPVGDDGSYVIGMKTLDLPQFRVPLADHESWCDVFYWFYFDALGADRVAMHFGGSLSYVTEGLARAWLAELVFLAIRWETITVAPVLLKHAD